MRESPLQTLAPTPAVRRAVSLADRIQGDVLSLALSPSAVLGSERQMRARYGVGVGTLREAVRILELREFGRMRPGPGGGFVVTLPSLRLATQALTGYLCLGGITATDLLQAHGIVGDVAITFSLRGVRGGEEGSRREAATGLLAAERSSRLLSRVAEQSGSMPVRLWAQCVDVLFDLVPVEPDGIGIGAAHALKCEPRCLGSVLAALQSGRERRARRILLGHEQHIGRVCRDHDAPVALWHEKALPINVTNKRAGQIARNIVVQIMRGRIAPGSRIGTEADIRKHYRVCKSIGAQVVRLLEEIDVARCHRGRSGGVYVQAPSRHRPIQVVHSFLRSHRVSVAECGEVGRSIKAAAAFERARKNPLVGLALESLQTYRAAEAD